MASVFGPVRRRGVSQRTAGLDVFALSQDNGGNVVQWDCWNRLNQQWLSEDPDWDGWFQLNF